MLSVIAGNGTSAFGTIAPGHGIKISVGQVLDALIGLADTAQIIADEKHACRAGIKAQPGIDL